MRVLICTAHFYPENTPRAFRATELAKELSRKGHFVTVITRRIEQMNGQDELINIELESFMEKGHPARYGAKVSWVQGKLRSILHHFFYFPEIKDTLPLYFRLQSRHDYDLVISNAFPYSIHLAVALARVTNSRLGKVFVADCGDPLTGNKESRYRLPCYFAYIEKWVLNNFNFITIPVESAKKAYPSFLHDKIRIIPQGFDFEQFNSARKQTKNAHPTFAYAGSLSSGVRDPGRLLTYLGTRVDVNFQFTIYTAQEDMLSTYKNMLGDKLDIKTPIPRNSLIAELNKFDFVVNIENIGDVQSPSKLIDYSIAGVPILSINPRNIDTQKIDLFLRGDYSMQTYVDLANYDIKRVADQFIALTN